jgi:hypothetical protein
MATLQRCCLEFKGAKASYSQQKKGRAILQRNGPDFTISARE